MQFSRLDTSTSKPKRQPKGVNMCNGFKLQLDYLYKWKEWTNENDVKMCASQSSRTKKEENKHKSNIECCGCGWGCIMLFCNGVVFLSCSSSRPARSMSFGTHTKCTISSVSFHLPQYPVGFMCSLRTVQLNVATWCDISSSSSPSSSSFDWMLVQLPVLLSFDIQRTMRSWIIRVSNLYVRKCSLFQNISDESVYSLCCLFLSHSIAVARFKPSISNSESSMCVLYVAMKHSVSSVFGSFSPTSEQCCSHVLLMLFECLQWE